MTMRDVRAAVIIGGILAVMGIASPALAQGTPPLLACFVPGSGTMYIVGQTSAPAACRASNHVMLQWNVAGPAGPAGPAATLPGSGLLSNFETVAFERRLIFVQLKAILYEVVSCPAGKVALGGGFSATGGNATDVLLIASLPQGSNGGSVTDWAFAFRFLETTATTASVGVALYLTCATKL